MPEQAPTEKAAIADKNQKGLASIIGQEAAVQRLREFASLYSQAGKPPGHVLLIGADGMGKRTIGQAFAAGYCKTTMEIEVGAVNKVGDLLGTLTNLGDGDAALLGDLAGAPKAIVGTLAEALRELAIDFVVDKGKFARTVRVPLNRFTCIGWSRSEADCPTQLVEVFPLIARIQSYSQTELEKICNRVAQKRGISIAPGVPAMIAGASAGSPHKVDLLVSRLAAVATGTVTESDVNRILSAHGLDTAGADLSGAAPVGLLSGIEFEVLISALLQRMGFRTEMTKASGDGGVDIIATIERPILRGRYIFQCKRFSSGSLVDAATVREFYGALTADPQAIKGVLVTTSGFTSQAREFARQLRIELLDGDQLGELLTEHGLLPSNKTTAGSTRATAGGAKASDNLLDIIR